MILCGSHKCLYLCGFLLKFGSVNQKNIGQKIRRIRQSMDLSQENVAEDLGMTKGAFSKIERGLTNIPVARLIEIAAVLKVDVGDFFEKENKKTKIEDHIPQYGFASKSDIEELVKMIQSLAKEVNVLKIAIDEMKTAPKTKPKK